MIALVFPGQGAQFEGMGKDLYEQSDKAKHFFNLADELMDFSISNVMFTGTAEDLKQTKVTQPAVFLYSLIKYLSNETQIKPDAVAGHSLGEITALVANKCLSFEDGLNLVSKRASAMQMACEQTEGTMAAILGLDNEVVESLCNNIDEIVVAANYNCPGQLVISGSIEGINLACEAAKEAGARRALPLPVGGAFHSPLMEPAKELLARAINETSFKAPSCPIYQNVDALPYSDPERIKENLITQLTHPVRWTQTMSNMSNDGVNKFVESGANVLSGFVKRFNREIETEQL